MSEPHAHAPDSSSKKRLKRLNYDLPFPVSVGMLWATGPYTFATVLMLGTNEPWTEPLKLLAILIPTWAVCVCVH